jgi:DNA-binding transcriptional MerR regulator
LKYGLVETEKLYFTSSEAAEQIGVSVEILRLWEKKFLELKPQKNKAGKRVYRQSDIEIAKQIKESAPEVEKQPRKKAKTKPANKELLLKIRNNLQDVVKTLRSPVHQGEFSPRPGCSPIKE